MKDGKENNFMEVTEQFGLIKMKQTIEKENLRNCVCTKCNFSMPAPQGVDCSLVKCSRCGSSMRIGGTSATPVEVKK